jgi:hypothetical protein
MAPPVPELAGVIQHVPTADTAGANPASGERPHFAHGRCDYALSSALVIARASVQRGYCRWMSRENREVVRRNNDAYNRRDLRAYLETVSESVGFRSRFSAMDNRGYEGHDGLRRYFAEVDEAWGWYEMNLERLVDAGARVVGLFHLQSHWP